MAEAAWALPPVRRAGALVLASGVLQLVWSVAWNAVPGQTGAQVLGRVIVLVCAALLGAAAVVVVTQRERPVGVVVRVAGFVFAAAEVLAPIVGWLAPDAPGPTAVMYLTSTAATVIWVIGWAAGVVGVIGLLRTRREPRPVPIRAAVAAAVAFGLGTLAVVVQLLVALLAPGAPQELLVPLYFGTAALAPLVLIATGLAWLYQARGEEPRG